MVMGGDILRRVKAAHLRRGEGDEGDNLSRLG